MWLLKEKEKKNKVRMRGLAMGTSELDWESFGFRVSVKEQELQGHPPQPAPHSAVHPAP